MDCPPAELVHPAAFFDPGGYAGGRGKTGPHGGTDFSSFFSSGSTGFHRDCVLPFDPPCLPNVSITLNDSAAISMVLPATGRP